MSHQPPVRVGRLYLHVFAAAACVLPVASYVLTTFEWDAADIGIATAAMAIAGTLAAPFWGTLDDRTNWAPRAAVLLTAVTAVAAALTLGHSPHAVTWAVLALYGASRGPLEALLATRVLAGTRHRHRFGRVRSFGSLGWILGLLVAASVLTATPRHAELVFVAAGVIAASTPFNWGESRSRPSRAADAPGSVHAHHLPLREVLGVLAISGWTAIAMAGLVQFTAGWAHSALGAGPFLALAPIAVSAALELPAFRAVDHLARARRPVVIAMLAGPCLAPATLLLAAIPSPVALIAVQPLVATSFALWYIGQARLLAQAVEPDRLATAQTLGFALSVGGGGLFAGVVGGRIADTFGYRGLFASLAAVTLAGTVVALIRLLMTARTYRSLHEVSDVAAERSVAASDAGVGRHSRD